MVPGGADSGLESDWLQMTKAAVLSGDQDPVVSKPAVFSCEFIAQPLADGELTKEEANTIWAQTVGGEVADKAAFEKFWLAVDDLFEVIDDEEEETETEATQVLEEDDVTPVPETSPIPVDATRAMLSGEARADWLEAVGGTKSLATSYAPDVLVASKAAIFSCTFLSEPLLDLEISMEEAKAIWDKTIGPDVDVVEEETFGRFWAAIDVLFEYVDDEEDAAAASAAASKGGNSPGKDSSEDEAKYLSARSSLLDILSKFDQVGMEADEALQERIAVLCETMEASQPQVTEKCTH